MRFTTGTIFAGLMALANAYTQPDYSKAPEGNAIRYPGLNDQVPEGAPYEIKWDATLGEKVSLVLLRGPSSNVVPLETIVENIDNTGHYTWTPGYNLTPDTTHYGLLIVVEGTGAYQWSSQFGISKGKGSESTTTAAGSGSDSGAHSTVTVIEDKTTTYCPESEQTTSPAAPSSYSTHIETIVVTTTECPESSAAATTAPVPPVVTSVPAVPSSSRVPHVPSNVSTLKSTPLVNPTSTATAAPSSTPVFNGAGRTSISLGAVMAGLFAVMAF